MKYAFNVPTRTMTFTFDHGKKIDIELSKFDPAEKDDIYYYGAKQKLVDAAASAKTASEKSGLNVEVQRAMMIEEMRDRLYNGTAFERKESDGQGRIGFLVFAVAALYKLTTDEAMNRVRAMGEEARKSLAASPKVAAKIALIKFDHAKRAAEVAQAAITDEEELPII